VNIKRTIGLSFILLTMLVATSRTMALGGERMIVDEAAYWELIQHMDSTVQGLAGSSMDRVTSTLEDLAAELEVITEVRTASGEVIPIDNGYLLNALRAPEPDLENINGLLHALLAAHEEYPGRVFSSNDLISLHRILASPEFSWPVEAPNPVREWLQKMWNRILNWLGGILGDGITIDLSSVNLFALICFTLFVVVLLFVFRTLFADFVRETQAENGETGADQALTSQSAFEKAQSLSRGGDFRSAVRYLYLSSLLVLNERGLLRYDRSRTNREYLRSISDSPELAKPLEEVIEVFDNVWYGYHSLEEETFKHYSERVQELKEKKG
jgi:hypothetical protein